MGTYRAVREKSIVKYTQGNPLPLGVSEIDVQKGLGKSVNFSVALPDKKECRLNIYYKGTDDLAESIVLNADYKFGSIFCIRIESLEYEKFEYLYEADGIEFTDPYAKIITGRTIFGETPSDRKVKCGFYWKDYDWEGDKFPRIPYHELILYRLHVRGFTKHISSKVKHKGTFKGIAEKIPYLKDLGINAVELMTFHEFDEKIDLSDPNHFYGNRLTDRGVNKIGRIEKEPSAKVSKDPFCINYWGYSNSGNYFAPKVSYASDTEHPAEELKDLIRELHKNGIEIIMELYFPPSTNQELILDALHYWMLEYHVDGFKINTEVASTDLIGTDPLLSMTKLFGNGWDTERIYGSRIPEDKNLAEYNEGYLMDMRKFLKSDEEMAGRVAGRVRRNPLKHGVINYITNTNGFTLMDLVSYDVKHNEANGENGKDGTDYNYSWNCGFEGKTKRKKVLELRRKQIRNGLTALFFSQGTPLLLSGDEFGNSQGGNNNAYCQDNAVCWLNWNQAVYNQDILEFVKNCIAIRKAHPILHMDTELKGLDYISCGCPDISFHGTKAWYPDYSNYSRVLGVFFCGTYAVINKKYTDDDFYIAFNMHWEPHTFDLPMLGNGKKWSILIDTSAGGKDKQKRVKMEDAAEQKDAGDERCQRGSADESMESDSLPMLPNEDILMNQKQYAVEARSILVFIGKESRHKKRG